MATDLICIAPGCHSTGNSRRSLSCTSLFHRLRSSLVSFITPSSLTYFCQGSTFIYDSYLAPYFTRNEASIDASITTAQNSMVVFLQERLKALWDLVWRFAGQVQAAQSSQAQSGGGAPAAPTTGSPADVVSNMWRTYGPSVISGLTRAAYNGPAPANTPSASQSEQNASLHSQSASPASTPPAQPYPRAPFSASSTE